MDQVVIEGHGAPRALDRVAIVGNDRMENVPLGVMHDANRPMDPCTLNLSLPLHPYVQARLPVGQSVNPLSVWQAGGLARGGISQGRGQEESRSPLFLMHSVIEDKSDGENVHMPHFLNAQQVVIEDTQSPSDGFPPGVGWDTRT